MANKSDAKTTKKSYGLMAIGSSDAWDITIDESLDEEGRWEAEIEGPNVYISYSFDEFDVIKDALVYLQTRILAEPGGSAGNSKKQDGLTLGKFGASRIALIWDDEDFDRCFIVVGPTSGSTIRFSLSAHDIEMMTRAFLKGCRTASG